MSDKDRRQKQINEMHEKAITGLLSIAQYRDFSAAKHEEIALYYAIGYLMSGKEERAEA